MAVGTTALIAAGVGAAGSIAGGALQSSAAGKAADAQTAAAQDANALQKYIFDTNRDDFAQYREIGGDALNVLAYLDGVGSLPTVGGGSTFTPDELNALKVTELRGTEGPSAALSAEAAAAKKYLTDIAWQEQYAPLLEEQERTLGFAVGDKTFDTQDEAKNYLADLTTAAERPGFEYQGFEETPGYQFQMEQGVRATDMSAAARGMLNSGATIKAQTQFGQGLAAQEFNNYKNSLRSLANVGQTATQTTAALGANYANAAGANTLAAGQARGSAYAQQGNIWGNALNNLGGFAGQALGYSGYGAGASNPYQYAGAGMGYSNGLSGLY